MAQTWATLTMLPRDGDSVPTRHNSWGSAPTPSRSPLPGTQPASASHRRTRLPAPSGHRVREPSRVSSLDATSKQGVRDRRPGVGQPARGHSRQPLTSPRPGLLLRPERRGLSAPSAGRTRSLPKKRMTRGLGD